MILGSSFPDDWGLFRFKIDKMDIQSDIKQYPSNPNIIMIHEITADHLSIERIGESVRNDSQLKLSDEQIDEIMKDVYSQTLDHSVKEQRRIEKKLSKRQNP